MAHAFVRDFASSSALVTLVEEFNEPDNQTEFPVFILFADFCFWKDVISL